MSGEDGDDAFHFFLEAHVKVPFIANLEWFHSLGDGVLGQLLEVGIPVGIDRPVSLKVAPDPAEELVPGLALGHFHSVVKADEAAAVLEFDVKTLKVLVGHVAAPAITVEDDAVRVLQLRGIAGPALGQVNLGVQGIPHVLVELLGE